MCSPMMRAAASTSLTVVSVFPALVGLTSTATRAAPGTSSRKSSSRFATNSPLKKLIPVALPPGRAKLATRPSLTGSSETFLLRAHKVFTRPNHRARYDRAHPYNGRHPGRPHRSNGLPPASCLRPDVSCGSFTSVSRSVPSGAAWATRERRGESGHQSPSHRCNRVRNVAFRPQRRILWAGNLRVRQIAGTAWWPDLLRGESFRARRSGIRRPQCKGWRDGGSGAIPVLQNVPARPPA